LRTNSSNAEEQGFRNAVEAIPVPRQSIADIPVLRNSRPKRTVWLAILLVGILMMAGILRARGFGVRGNSTSSASEENRTSAALDIGILVFREGLECILVLAAVTASLRGSEQKYQRPVSVGAGMGFVATLLTWCVAVRIVDDIGEDFSALAVQAATGLLAILILLVVMNWFFHNLYWTGWISLHNQRKRELLGREKKTDGALGVISGMALLGFTSFYREGFEVVLFLQSYRLKLGGAVVLYGVVLGVFGSAIVAVLTFMAHRRLPYRRMLVATGVMLAFVLLVMVGEEAQEMQLARWLPATEIPLLVHVIPSWMGLWFSVFPTVETLTAQALAGFLVFGSYITAQPFARFKRQVSGESSDSRTRSSGWSA
jgi:high-affinity iron transporter